MSRQQSFVQPLVVVVWPLLSLLPPTLQTRMQLLLLMIALPAALPIPVLAVENSSCLNLNPTRLYYLVAQRQSCIRQQAHRKSLQQSCRYTAPPSLHPVASPCCGADDRRGVGEPLWASELLTQRSYIRSDYYANSSSVKDRVSFLTPGPLPYGEVPGRLTGVSLGEECQ